MYRIGIECHNLENRRWGIGRHLSQILEEITNLANKSELAQEFRFYLYFKGHIPNDLYLNHPIFEKRVLKPFWLPHPSFNIFFHLMLPWAYRRDHLQAMFFASFMLPAFFTGKSLVVLTNDIYYEYTKGTLPWRYKLAYRFFSNWAAWRATLITTYTHYAKKGLVRLFGIKPEQIAVNYLGIDTEHFRSDPITPKKDYLLYVGQAFQRRRVKELIKAFSLIASEFPTLSLVLVGQDKYQPPILNDLLYQVNRKLGGERVFHHDYIQSDEDLLKLYQQARLFVYLSSSEAMGLPALEALAAGTPAVVKDNELNQEIYQGKAFYAPSETDPQAIAATLAQALKNTKRQQEIVSQREKIISKFNWSKHVQELLQQLRQLCKN